MPSGSVVASMVGAAAISAAKFAAGAVSGSGALLAEGIHSAVDCGNSGLMALGQKRSKRPPDEEHPFGHGKELYFWTLVVALVIFVVAGGATIAEGVARVVKPAEMSGVGWNYAVLAVAAAFNGYTRSVAFREFRRGLGGKTFWQGLKRAKDPTTLTVLFEDTASLIGIAIAFLGVLLSQLLDAPVLDGVATLLIGVVMAAVGLGLAAQCKQLLVGESAVAGVKAQMRSTVECDESVERVDDLVTMHLGPEQVLLTAVVRFRPELSAGEVGEAVGRLVDRVRGEHPEVIPNLADSLPF